MNAEGFSQVSFHPFVEPIGAPIGAQRVLDVAGVVAGRFGTAAGVEEATYEIAAPVLFET